MPRDEEIQALSAAAPETFQDVLRFWAERTPDAPVYLAESGDMLTFSGILDRIDEIGAALDACGFGRGDRIAVIHPGGIDLATAMVGLWCHATVAPLSPGLRLGEYAMYFRDLRVDAVAIAADEVAPARKAADRLGLPVLELIPEGTGGDGRIRLAGPSSTRTHEAGAAGPDDVATVILTSGTTTGRKLVPVRHKQLVLRAADHARRLGLTHADRCANMMQLHHGAGISAILYSPIAGGSVAHFADKDLRRVFGCLETLEPTYLSAPYTVFHAVLAQRERLRDSILRIRPALRFLRAGAGHLDERIGEGLEALFQVPVIRTYSSSEAGFIVCDSLPPNPQKRESVGAPDRDTVTVVDDDGKRLPPNAIGEVVVSGPKVFDGYENNPQLNAEAFTDGRFRMGDLGLLDDDGYLFLKGRIKEVINRGGQKIMPDEVDAAIMSHPAVAASATFPVPHPTLGDDVAAAVVCKPGSTVNRDDLIRFLRQRLEDPKVPKRIKFVDDIPKGDTGKIQRYDLAESLGLNEPATTEGAVSNVDTVTATEAKLQRLWGDVLQRDIIPRDEDFFVLGGDSIMAVDLFLRIEEEFGRRLPRGILFECGTVAAMAAAIESEQGTGCLVPIQPDGDGAIFFCIHGIDGDVLYFRDLARALGDAQPFYGIRARSLDGTPSPNTSIPAMADHYAGEMRKLQPTGPYYVGGYSFGGWIALEVARRLQDAGEEVALLAILDTTFVGRSAALPLSARLQRHMGRRKPNARPGPFEGSVPRMIAQQLRLDAMAMCRRFGLLDGALDSRFRRFPVEAHSIGLRLYRPKPYPGDAVLFHSECDAPQLARDYGGWQSLIGGTLATQPIPGSHSDMMYDPAVESLGLALSKRIAQAASDRQPGTSSR